MNDPAPSPAARGLLVKIPDAAELLSVGRSTVYDLISSGHLETVHIGRAVRIPISSIEDFIDQARTRTPNEPNVHRTRYSTGYSPTRTEGHA